MINQEINWYKANKHMFDKPNFSNKPNFSKNMNNIGSIDLMMKNKSIIKNIGGKIK